MAAITVTNVVVLNNPARFLDPFKLEITFDCLLHLKSDLEWRLVYIGSSEDEGYDQVLDSVLIGPLQPGTLRFLLETPPPTSSKIPTDELLGITAILLTCSYRDQEFLKIGYYVNNEYTDAVLIENPPETPDTTKIQRSILADKPRVTRFMIDWRDEPTAFSAAETEDDLETTKDVALLGNKSPYRI